MASPAATPKLLPWGRLVLQNKTRHSPLMDHCDLLRSRHCVGRVASRCDIHIPSQSLSALHCIIRLEGKDAKGEPVVEIEDVSRYGVWVNGVRVGTRRKAQLKKGDLLDLNPPNAKEPVCYKLEILPSGLTKQNEELHGRLSVDEMSVADRTRKRTIEDTQSTQSPSKPVLSPPRARPVKKPRKATNNRQTEEPASESDCTPATRQSAAENESQDLSPRMTGKSRSDVQPPSSKLAKLQEENIEYAQGLVRNAVELYKKSELLDKTQAELASLKKGHAEVLANLRKEFEALKNEKKTNEEEMKKVTEKAKADLDKQAEAARKASDELRHERDVLRRTIEDILTNPSTPKLERTVVELHAKIQALGRIRAVQNERIANKIRTLLEFIKRSAERAKRKSAERAQVLTKIKKIFAEMIAAPFEHE